MIDPTQLKEAAEAHAKLRDALRKYRERAHTDDWNKRSLGLVEATALRMAWGRAATHYVTGNCDERPQEGPEAAHQAPAA